MTPIDLHTHSCYSDGLLTPEALCDLALRKHLHTLSLCDHDTTDGLVPMAEAAQALAQRGVNLSVLPSVELSTGMDGLTHILGYGVHLREASLQNAMAELRRKRALRGMQMVERMRGLGVSIPPELLPDPAVTGVPIGRPHVARALTLMGAVKTLDQAYALYLAEGKPAYIPLAHWTTAEAIGLLRGAGAISVLAHPMRMALEPQAMEALVEALQAIGLEGVEAYHPSANRRAVRWLDAMARRRNLLVTGGSDFHGDRGSHAALGALPSGWDCWPEDLQALKDAMDAADKSLPVADRWYRPADVC